MELLNNLITKGMKEFFKIVIKGFVLTITGILVLGVPFKYFGIEILGDLIIIPCGFWLFVIIYATWQIIKYDLLKFIKQKNQKGNVKYAKEN